MICRLAKCFWAGLLLAPLPAAALELEVTPAWHGYVRPDAATEINLRVTADYGGRLSLVVAAGTTRVRHETELSVDLPIDVRLPIRPDLSEPIVIQATLAAKTRLTRTLTPKSPGRSLIAVVEAQPDDTLKGSPYSGHEPLVLRLNAAALPDYQSSYETIAGLILESSVLGELNTAQLGALKAYLGDCGPMVLLRPTEELLSTLRRSASCRGRYVKAAMTLHEALSTSVELRQHWPSPPAPTALRSLSPADGPDMSQLAALVFLFAGYALALVLAARFLGPSRLLLIVPLTFAALALLAWFNATPLSSTLSWAELDSGDTVARFTALLRIEGRGRAAVTLPISRRFGPPSPTATGQPLEFHQAPTPHLTVGSFLLSHHEFVLRGSTIVESPLELSVTASGPQVINTGPLLSRAGLLVWQGRRYVVPALMSGVRWIPPDASSAWSSSTLDYLLRARASGSEAALLVPYPELAAGLVGTTDRDGWLLIKSRRYESS